ncbi:hypothetical protein CEXT_588261 [Caerostris extrusa]|uniref:Uncharacterized protein n=1 Tax=Caerostris extrusa TaxID=172846 RepID=A0AAV4Q500_CAEEX|nr:hypothetical protein CEXT_588261 [Caerostris extrusa]
MPAANILQNPAQIKNSPTTRVANILNRIVSNFQSVVAEVALLGELCDTLQDDKRRNTFSFSWHLPSSGRKPEAHSSSRLANCQ